MRDVPANSAWAASITRTAERDNALLLLTELTDKFGFDGVRAMLDLLERNDLLAPKEN